MEAITESPAWQTEQKAQDSRAVRHLELGYTMGDLQRSASTGAEAVAVPVLNACLLLSLLVIRENGRSKLFCTGSFSPLFARTPAMLQRTIEGVARAFCWLN